MKRLALLVASCICLSGCATNAIMVRNTYVREKIAFPSTKDNFQLFKDSSFRSSVYYKTSLQSDFDILYFYSFYRSESNFAGYAPFGFWYSFHDSIISSKLLPGENFITLGNLFSDYLEEKDGTVYLTFYRLENDRIITKKMTLVIALSRSLLMSPGMHRSDRSNDIIHVELKGRSGKVLYSSGLDDQCFVQLDTQDVKDGVLYAALSADLKSISGGGRYKIYEGALWLKLQANQ
jgi:hypothetical protein